MILLSNLFLMTLLDVLFVLDVFETYFVYILSVALVFLALYPFPCLPKINPIGGRSSFYNNLNLIRVYVFGTQRPRSCAYPSCTDISTIGPRSYTPRIHHGAPFSIQGSELLLCPAILATYPAGKAGLRLFRCIIGPPPFLALGFGLDAPQLLLDIPLKSSPPNNTEAPSQRGGASALGEAYPQRLFKYTIT
jgi:hypothetical protein